MNDIDRLQAELQKQRQLNGAGTAREKAMYEELEQIKRDYETIAEELDYYDWENRFRPDIPIYVVILLCLAAIVFLALLQLT